MIIKRKKECSKQAKEDKKYSNKLNWTKIFKFETIQQKI